MRNTRRQENVCYGRKARSELLTESERIEWPLAVVWQIGTLRFHRRHRRRELERQLALGFRPTRQHVDQRLIAQAEVRDERARPVADGCENRGTVEIYGRDRRDDRTGLLERLVIGVAVLERQAAFVEERREDVTRVRMLERRDQPHDGDVGLLRISHNGPAFARRDLRRDVVQIDAERTAGAPLQRQDAALVLEQHERSALRVQRGRLEHLVTDDAAGGADIYTGMLAHALRGT